jgi:SAM-dependent methyltransferase
MSSPSAPYSTTDYYETNAPALTVTYELVEADKLNSWFADVLPSAPACVLDIGAGSGRDAAWLASRGFDVVAVEPAAGMVREARRLHAETAIHWVEGDSLPGLEQTLRRGQAFDFILLSAVWMHVPVQQRTRAFRKIISLMKPGARLAMTLRHGPAADGQVIHEVSAAEIEGLARAHGAYVERVHHAVPDQTGRSEVSWTQVVVRLPDDGTGALPLLRQIILNDKKETTYKLALLRALARIADGAAGLTRSQGDEFVAVPLGLVGLYWLRLFKPLLAANLPQRADNVGFSKLGFVGAPYLALEGISHLDLRVGMAGFSPEIANALHGALRDAINTIVKMPARYTTYADGKALFQTVRLTCKPQQQLRLDEPYLAGFGDLLVPVSLWMALQRFNVWIEPAIEAEWERLMKRFLEGQQRTIDDGAIRRGMFWPDPDRDVRMAREQALAMIESGPLHCVWSEKPLSPNTLDMDHCLPFAVWSCDDLWNLLPVHPSVNRSKGDRLPSVGLLRRRQGAIIEWWERGYLAAKQPWMRDRFEMEARATLPTIGVPALTPEDVFSGLLLQQMRLRHNQQAPVWKM